jgi:hypothetical protein
VILRTTSRVLPLRRTSLIVTGRLRRRRTLDNLDRDSLTLTVLAPRGRSEMVTRPMRRLERPWRAVTTRRPEQAAFDDVQRTCLRGRPARSSRIAARFEVPLLAAALLVIPAIAIEQSDVHPPQPSGQRPPELPDRDHGSPARLASRSSRIGSGSANASRC